WQHFPTGQQEGTSVSRAIRGNGTWVARQGGPRSWIRMDSDGQWQPLEKNFKDLTFGNGYWMGLETNDQLWRSTDLLNWTLILEDTDALSAGGGAFVIEEVGPRPMTYRTSGLTFAGGQFIIAGVTRSHTGEEWTMKASFPVAPP